MGLSGEQFVQSLEASGLLSSTDLSKLRERLLKKQGQEQADVLARVLVAENLLTPYQADALLRGDDSTLVLGNYILLDALGEGGMGRVYKAWHRRMKRVVALKTLPEELAKDERALDRFHREVETAARLTHRNIVTAYDADEVEGVHFLVMEYVEGRDLATVVLEEGPLSVGAAMRAILDAARGLAYAHQQGIIHRDIKPSNLLLDITGMVKVLDLGLARPQQHLLSDAGLMPSHLTASGAVVGTVDYLAPEQALNTKRADQRADIYSLGVTFFFLLSGRVPYQGETAMERLIAHREQPLPSLRDVCPQAPLSLEELLQRMMAKSPEDRFQSMLELVKAFEACLQELPADVQAAQVGHEESSPIDQTTVSLVKTHEFVEDYSTAYASPAANRRNRKAFVAAAAIGFSLVALLVVLAIDPLKRDNGAGQGLVGTAHDALAHSAVEAVRRQFPAAPALATAGMTTEQAQDVQQEWARYLGLPVQSTNSAGMQLQLVPPGTFKMGSSKQEIEALKSEAIAEELPEWYLDLIPTEGPQHTVLISFPLLVSAFEVTQREYEHVMGDNPSQFSTSDTTDGASAEEPAVQLPVEYVDWYDAIRFCNALSEREGFRPCYHIDGILVNRADGDGYRLPTEAEWEYICRAGTTTRWYFGDDESQLVEAGHYDAERTQPVGQTLPNAWGFYDLYGNVWEWCEDSFDPRAYESVAIERPDVATQPPSGRVVRGGSYKWPAAVCRSANRTYYVPHYLSDSHGLRVLREVRERKSEG